MDDQNDLLRCTCGLFPNTYFFHIKVVLCVKPLLGLCTAFRLSEESLEKRYSNERSEGRRGRAKPFSRVMCNTRTSVCPCSIDTSSRICYNLAWWVAVATLCLFASTLCSYVSPPTGMQPNRRCRFLERSKWWRSVV